MDPILERARHWSWRRQRLDRSCRGVEDCLRSVIGVPSANPQGPLSLLARVPRLMKGAAVEGVIGTKRAVRIPAMRRSVFMVPTDHAGRLLAAMRPPEATSSRLMDRAGMGEVAFDRLRGRILAAAADPASVEQIRAALSRPPRIIPEILASMCARGELVGTHSHSIRANDLTYAATEAWLGSAFPSFDRAESLTWLAGDYLSAFGPACVEDFAWWTGQPLEVARAAMLAHDPVDLGGGLLLHGRDVRAFEGLRPMTGRVNLLPKGDCYTMGYAEAGRERFCDPSVRHHAYSPAGEAQPVVLVEGKVGGTWSLRLTPTRARLVLSLFSAPGPKLRAKLEDEAMMIGSFFDARATTVQIDRVLKGRARGAAPKKRATPKKRVPAKKIAR